MISALLVFVQAFAIIEYAHGEKLSKEAIDFRITSFGKELSINCLRF